MRNIYIDLGCYDGDTVEQWRNWSKLHYGDKEWFVYAFDANPKWQNVWVNTDNTIFEHKAAWIEDTKVEFAVDQADTPLGSTLMPGKKAIWDTSPKIKVQAFDFSKWLKRFSSDLVVVKMDVEGAEFPILEKMLQDGTATIPNRLLVEFHPNKVQEYTTTYKVDLIKKLKKQGVQILEWH